MENKTANINYKIILLSFFTFLLILIAGFRPLEYFRDTSEYLYMIHTYDEIFQTEPTFWLINQFNKILLGGEDQIFFLLYAIIGVAIKMYVIKKYSITPILSMITYISLFYILHEMTQMRAGVAIGIVFLSLEDVVKRNKISFLIKILAATLFHYSAIIFLLIYFLSSKKINGLFYILIPLAGVFISFKNWANEFIIYMATIMPDFLSLKIELYLSLKDQEVFKELNLFSIGTFFLLGIYYFILYIAKKKVIIEGYYILCIKLYGFSFFILFTLSFLDVFAYRIANYFLFSLVFLLPLFVRYFKQKILVVIVILIYLLYTIIRNISGNILF